MNYKTTVTSKGTITIAAPLRKALGIKAGQKLRLALNKNNQIVVDAGTDLKAFENMRAQITKKIPPHLHGLSGEELRAAAARAWVVGQDD